MKTLPNGITIFNATPHNVRFWSPEWTEPVEVESDAIISAEPQEKLSAYLSEKRFRVVRVAFAGNDEGARIINRAKDEGADVIVGSIIASLSRGSVRYVPV